MTKHSNTGRHRPAVMGVFALVAAGGALALGASGASASINAASQTSQNWSGYVAQSASSQNFSSVSGSWVQPTVNASASSGASAFWVGLGGSSQASQSLEQVGTSADVTNGQTEYYAWYELVPSPQARLDLPIHPGDHMSGKVTVSGDSVNIWLSDDTTGQSVTKDLQMTSPDTSSAEWIAEAPAAQSSSGGYQILPLADFGQVTFTGASATADGHTGSISDPSWSVQQVDMSAGASRRFLDVGGYGAGSGTVGQGSAGGASAGDVSSDGSSFTVSYGSGQSVQPASVDPSGGYDPGSSDGYGDPGYGYGYGGGGSSGYGDPGYGYGGGSGYGYGYGYGDPYGYSSYAY